MKRKDNREHVGKTAKRAYMGKVWRLFGMMMCLIAGLLVVERAQAESRDISLGTQADEAVDVKLGDILNFSLNTTDEASIYYSIREEIATVNYSVEYEFDEVLSQKSDTTFEVTGVGSTYLTVLVSNQDGEEISERSYRISSSVDMSGVTLEKSSIKGYRYGQEYAYKTFYVKVKGLAEGFEEYIDFSYTSSNKNIIVYCKLDGGQIVIEAYGIGVTRLEFTINGKVFTLKLTISQVKLSGSTSLLMLPKATKTLTVKGISAKVTWKSSNPKVLSVSKTGKIKAKKAGNAIIIASVGSGKLGCVVSVVTPTRKKVIAKANSIGKNWKYSQAKRMQKGYYDCSSLVWKSYNMEKQYFGMKSYAPVAADLAKWCAGHKKLVKGNAYQNIQKMKYRPGALTFKTGSNNGRYKGIYHVEMFVGYTFEGFDVNGKPILGTKWAAREDNYFYGELWAQP